MQWEFALFILLSKLPMLSHTSSPSNVTYSTLPVFASGGLDFQFWDYFQLVARCIVHACACYTMSRAHIIQPIAAWSVWHWSCLAAWCKPYKPLTLSTNAYYYFIYQYSNKYSWSNGEHIRGDYQSQPVQNCPKPVQN